MASIKYTNNANTALAADITNSATSATVVNGNLLPSLSAGEHFYFTFDDGTNTEIVKVTARSTHVLTIVRAQDNTSARAFSSGDKAELRVTAAVLEEVRDNINATANNSTDETVFPTFVDGATGTQGLETDTGLTYNPSSGTLTATAFAGALTGNVTGNASGSSGSTTGNAATATALATARTIGGTSFDGSANIAVALAATSTALATARTIGGTSFDGSANIVPATITVADTTDTSSFVALFESATGDLAPKTDAAITYNAGTGALTATSFVGALTGNVTGNASGTAATVTGGTQASITAAANLVTVGTIGTGVWQGTAIASAYIAADAITGAKIADDAIDSEHYTDGSIDNAHIADDAIDSEHYAAGSIDTAHIADDQVTGAKIENAVTIATSATSPLMVATTSARITQVAISSSSNATAWDAAAAANAYYVTSENTTISAPSNAVEGAIISIEIAQGGTARTVAWNTVFEFAASTAPTVTATASKTDIFSFRYNGSVWQEIGRVQNMAQT